MKKSVLFFMFSLCFVPLFSQTIHNGTLDLSKENITGNRNFNVSGKMGFYNRQFVSSPEEVRNPQVFID